MSEVKASERDSFLEPPPDLTSFPVRLVGQMYALRKG